MESYNIKTLQDLSKNVHMALKSIEHLNKSIEDKSLETELTSQYKIYQDMAKRISDELIEKAVESKELNPFEKAMLFSSIKLNTLTNNSTSHIADMLIKGTVMGVNELTKLKHECENAKTNEKNKKADKCCCSNSCAENKDCEKETTKLIDELLNIEEDFITRLKKFL